MKEITINSLQDFKKHVSDNEYHRWMYRGQNKYEQKLESSLFRAFQRNIIIRSAAKMKKVTLIREIYEKEMIDSFQRSSHLFLKSLPDKKSKFDWLQLCSITERQQGFWIFHFLLILRYFLQSLVQTKMRLFIALTIQKLRQKIINIIMTLILSIQK